MKKLKDEPYYNFLWSNGYTEKKITPVVKRVINTEQFHITVPVIAMWVAAILSLSRITPFFITHFLFDPNVKFAIVISNFGAVAMFQRQIISSLRVLL